MNAHRVICAAALGVASVFGLGCHVPTSDTQPTPDPGAAAPAPQDAPQDAAHNDGRKAHRGHRGAHRKHRKHQDPNVAPTAPDPQQGPPVPGPVDPGGQAL